jgi:hypothetical protein
LLQSDHTFLADVDKPLWPVQIHDDVKRRRHKHNQRNGRQNRALRSQTRTITRDQHRHSSKKIQEQKNAIRKSVLELSQSFGMKIDGLVQGAQKQGDYRRCWILFGNVNRLQPQLIEQMLAVLLENHGVLAFGANPAAAARANLIVEEAAQIAIFAEVLGGAKIIPPELLQASVGRRDEFARVGVQKA